MDQQHLSHVAHTRVPNLIADVVSPLLPPSEAIILGYIIRRTYGFADENGGRKARDVISLDQFEHGISSGTYLLDLGTQLSRGTIKKGLEGLIEKDLVEVRSSCSKCFWDQDAEAAAPTAEAGQAPQCPRCRATLSRSFALAKLTPRKVISLLNEYDKKKRVWTWDNAAQRFRWQDSGEVERRNRSQEDLREEAQRLRRLLWYPDMVDRAVEMAEKQLKAGRRITINRRIRGFYRPVWELQEHFANPPLLKYGLEATLKSDVLRQPNTDRWHRYLLRVCENNEQNFRGAPGPRPGTNAEAESQNSLRSREMAVRELLGRAADHNNRGERDAARQLLSDVLSQTRDLAPLFDGDRQRCEWALREAFKQGERDFVAVRPDPYALDYYPEWSWPDQAEGEGA